jgi:hypothetical protein
METTQPVFNLQELTTDQLLNIAGGEGIIGGPLDDFLDGTQTPAHIIR